MSSITPKKLIKKLKKLGFAHQRTTGSHMIFKNTKTGYRANIPFHLKEIKQGTLSAILRESGVHRKDIL